MLEQEVLYGVDDNPPFFSCILLGVQHVVKFSLLLICPILIAQAATGGVAQIVNTMAMTLLISAIATCLFAFKRIGGGYFFPVQASVPFFALSLLAAHMGGLGLVVGVALVAALVQLILAPLLARLHGRLLAETTAIMIIMLGIWAAQLGVNELFHPGALGKLIVHGSVFSYRDFNFLSALPGFITLLVLLILKPWGNHRSHCILYAMVIGSVIGWFMHTVPSQRLDLLGKMAWFACPHLLAYHHVQFHLSLLLPCILIALLGSYEALSITRAIDSSIQRPPKANRYLRTQIVVALTTALTGMGGVITSIVPGSIGDFVMSSVFSRAIAWVYAPILLLLAFMPKVAAFMLLIPASVNGAVIVFMGAVMLLKGIKMLDLTALSPLRSKVYGVAMVCGICTLIVPSLVSVINRYAPWVTNPAALFSFIILCVLLLLLWLRGGYHA